MPDPCPTCGEPWDAVTTRWGCGHTGTEHDSLPDQTVTITVRREDAYALALGPLDYAVKVMNGEAVKGGSPMRVRQALAAALGLQAEKSAP